MIPRWPADCVSRDFALTSSPRQSQGNAMTRSAQMLTAAIGGLLILAMGTNGQTMSQTILATGTSASVTRSSASGQVVSVTRAGAPSVTNSAVTTHTILVGKLDHKFEPDVVQAPVGDIIQFQFYPVNHSIVRAEYGYPCVPYEMTGVGKVGFYSGFRPVDAILDDVSVQQMSRWCLRLICNSHPYTGSGSTTLYQFSSIAQLREVV
ncbi:hypothetical protein BKA81DRAFT_123406 [Phyllosticta paracitricarpa]